MNIRQMEYFLKLCETGSMSQAASDLFISQQGLSRSIRCMEDELQLTLFERSSQGTSVTEHGRMLYDNIHRIVDEYEDLMRTVRQSVSHEKKLLRVAFPFGFFNWIFPVQLIVDFRETYTDIDFQDLYCPDKGIEDMLREGSVDLAITTGRVRHQDLSYINLFRSYRCITVNRSHPLAKKSLVSFEDLRGLRVGVFFQECYDYDFLINGCGQLGFMPTLFPCTESNTLLQIAIENMGVSLMSTGGLPGHPKHRDTVDLLFSDWENACYDIAIARPRNRRASRNETRFIQHLQEYTDWRSRKIE